MMTEEVEKELQALGNPKQAILCGIEAHACIAVRWQNIYRYYIVIMGFLLLLYLSHMCTINKTMLQFINIICRDGYCSYTSSHFNPLHSAQHLTC